MAAVNNRPTPTLALPLTARFLAARQAEQMPKGAQQAAAAGTLDFGSLLGQSISEVNNLQNQSTHSVEEMLTGGDVQPAEVFASIQKADMAFRMLLQVRNKLMQAYEEVNQIRI